MGRTVWLIVGLMTVSLLVSACGGETTETPASTPDEARIPVQPSTPVPTAELESVVRRVLAEARAAEPTPETPEPAPTVDVEALAFEVTERVLATLEARETSTPEPTPDPTPTATPTPEPTPSLPEVVRAIQKSLIRVTAVDGQLLATGVVVGVDASTGEVFVLAKHRPVANAGMLEASTTGGAEYEAAIHGSDEKRDLALLRLCCDTEATPAPFGDALTLPIGNEVVAMEYVAQPGKGIVVSRGVLSSVRFDAEGERWMIQTDASASGETGGVLITPDGRLIGLITGRAGVFADAVSEVTLSEVLPNLR